MPRTELVLTSEVQDISIKMSESKSKTGQLREEIIVVLSEDVLVEILARIPVKSLMRFKCVCKSWYCFISNPAFIRKHFLNYTNNPDNSRQLLVVSEPRNYIPGYAFSMVSSRDDTFLEQLARGGIPTKLDTTLLKDFMGTDHELFAYKCYGFGIVCLRNHVNDNIALWNPTTREFRILPELLEPICISPYTRAYYPPLIYCGLGFDSICNDYKLVHFGYHKLYNGTDIEEEPVALYSFSTNSWKILDVKFIGLPLPDCQTAYINDLPWWLASEISEFNDLTGYGYEFVASFDVTAEMVRYYQLPESCRGFYIKDYSLFQLHGYLGLAFCPQEYTELQDKSTFDIWVMKESVAEVTWNKIFSVGPFQMVDIVIGFWPGRNVLVLQQESKQLMLYDVTTRKIVHCEFEFPTELDMFKVQFFTDSLVHVGGRIDC